MNTDKSQSSIVADTGVIHGRFQILHNDHMTYLLTGKKHCRHLVVGITNPDPFLTKKEAADPARHEPAANPLTYYERLLLIRASLTEAGLGHGDFSVVPFPINRPELYEYYVPMDALFFLSIYDDWGRQKLRYFNSLGLKTLVLREVPNEEKGLSASDVRKRIKQGDPWEHLVPKPIYTYIQRWGIIDRL